MAFIPYHYHLFQECYSTEDMRTIWQEEHLVQKWLDIEAEQVEAVIQEIKQKRRNHEEAS